jgi:protein-S-isoprenylcysteine O-methyltransferase Ste14
MAGNPSVHILYPVPAAILVSVGSIFLIIAFRDLGDSLRVGLPGEETLLKTKGIYRFSRNPIYVGVDLIAIASVLFIPGIINIVCAIIGIAVHHAIILSEEKFLEGCFGKDWLSYKRKTRRYF